MNHAFPQYTIRERIADGCIHVLGVSASLIAAAILMTMAAKTLPPLSTASVVVYGIGMISVFALSASYNLVMRPDLKGILRRFDQAAIYIKIAGTYTPFAVLKIDGTAGTALLVTVWAISIFGVALKLVWPTRLVRTSFALYLATGWAGVFAFGPLTAALPPDVLTLLLVGGVLYTLGVAFHLSQLPYHNAIWHAFVLAASCCHFDAVLRTVLIAA